MVQIKQPRSLRGDIVIGAALIAGLGAPAAAQDAPESEPIIVTADRPDRNPYADPDAPYRVVRSASGLLTEELIDTPKAVTVLPEEVIEDLGAATFRDLFRTQPGVTLGTGEGGNAFGDRIFIRGFDARNDVFIDGVRDPGVGSREVFAVQQIEILRGPSSTFGGRGVTGGQISLISKQPGEGNWGDVDLVLGTDDTRRVAIDVNRQLTDDFAVRLNAMVHESNVAGRDHVFNDRWGWTLAAAYQPSDALRLGFDYYHLSTDYLPDWGVPYDVANNEPFDVDRNNFYGILSRDFGETFSDIYSGTLDWRLNDAAVFHSILRYGQSLNAYTASAPEQPDPIARTVRANAKRRDAVTEYWTNQSHLTVEFDSGPMRHTLVAGYELAREEILNRQRAFTECAVLPCTGATSNPTLDLDDPDNTIPWPSGTGITGRPTITVETAALFALDTIEFSPQWRAFVGVRADAYSADTTGLTPERSSDSDYVNWHGGLVYKPIETASLYVSYGSSSNPPCEQLDAFSIDYGGCDPRVAALDPVRNTSIELGAKATLFGHFDATAAIFQIAREGVPIQVGGGATATIGEQDQEVVGLEFTVAGELTPAWSMFGGLTILDTEITESDVLAQISAQFPNVAETSFSLTSRHQLTERVHAGGTAVYNSEKFGGGVAAGTTRVPDFWRFDLFGGVQISDSVELSVNVLNVTDEVYYDAIYRSATPFTYIAPGRSAMVTLDIDF
ncbi:MAG: TonB-dependent receptor [Alphaproteobacteria bacterium]|nr:TonB-dependent receptor [Alphaproteobacteria bacterium]